MKSVFLNPLVLVLVGSLSCAVVGLPSLHRPREAVGRGLGGDRPPPPRGEGDCVATARRFSRMKGLMGGWRKVDLSKPSNLQQLNMNLVKGSVIEDLLKHMLEKPRPGDSRPALPPVNLTSMKIEPVELYTQLVAGVKMCAVVDVSSPCDGDSCKEPGIQCATEVVDIPWLEKGDVLHVHCIPRPEDGVWPEHEAPPRDRPEHEGPPRDRPEHQNLALGGAHHKRGWPHFI